MGTLQDALMNAHLEDIETLVTGHTAAPRQVVNGEIVTADSISSSEQMVSPAPASPPVEADVDEDGLADIIRARMARRQQFVAGRDARDAGLQKRRERLGKSEANLRDLYREKPEIEKTLQEETIKLAEAVKSRFLPEDIAVLQAGVQELAQDLASVAEAIRVLEVRHPDIKAKIDKESRVVMAHRRFLERFARETGDDKATRYVVKGTPTPDMATIKAADAFLAKSIKEASDLGLIVSMPQGETATFIAHDGSRWNPGHLGIAEGIEICNELNLYERAIKAVEQQNLQQWADKDVATGLLLTPIDVLAQKKDQRNRHNIVNLVRDSEGFCFIPIDSKKPAELLSYFAVRPELKIEYGDNKEGNKKHMLRVVSVTAPQFVEDFFFPQKAGGKRVTPTFYFDDIHEIATWRDINGAIRDSLNKAVRWAESREKEISVIKTLGDTDRLSNIKTLDQLAPPESAEGVAVIYIPRGRDRIGFDIGFEIQSDGITVRPGFVATDRSKKLPLYEQIMDGMSVVEFFARAQDGSFHNEALQDLAVRNEAFELKWLVPAAVATYTAEQVSADNVAGLVMLPDQGGRDGKYILQVPVKYKHGDKEMYREVAYVVIRENNKLTFAAGLTHYSVSRLATEGFALNTPHSVGELKGFILHVLQVAYSKALGMPYDKFPEHLKGAWARAKSVSAAQVGQDS